MDLATSTESMLYFNGKYKPRNSLTKGWESDAPLEFGTYCWLRRLFVTRFPCLPEKNKMAQLNSLDSHYILCSLNQKVARGSCLLLHIKERIPVWF